MMEETGWICRLDESRDERQRKSTYDTQSLRNITLGPYWAITLPRVMISMRARRCVYEREKGNVVLDLCHQKLKKEEKSAFKT